MTDLKDQLQRTLGSNYTLERELGGGGLPMDAQRWRVLADQDFSNVGRKRSGAWVDTGNASSSSRPSWGSWAEHGRR